MASHQALGERLAANISWTGVNTSSTNGSSTWTTTLNSTDVQPFETALLAVIIVVVVLVIFLLFALALYLDCRQQRIEAVSAVKKTRTSPKKFRIPTFISNSSANQDALAFVNEMCKENGDTLPPSDAPTTSCTSVPGREQEGSSVPRPSTSSTRVPGREQEGSSVPRPSTSSISVPGRSDHR